MPRRRAGGLPLAGVAAVAAALVAAPPAAAQIPGQQPVCTPDDAELGELSGLAAGEDRWYAVADGGRRLWVAVLAPDCSLVDEITARIDPVDVEDLALAADGALWLADTGDNDRGRENIALHRLTPDGEATRFRLSYPDGSRDAEALLLDRAGTPFLVTKEPFGTAGVYRPDAELAAPGPIQLRRVASMPLPQTPTPGGPLGSFGSALITGAASSADGSVLALRTYTDAYLYPAPDGDVVAAFSRPPLRVPLPGETQGEAIAFTPDGTLLSASEGGDPLRAVPGAAQLLTPGPPPGIASAPGRLPPRNGRSRATPGWTPVTLCWPRPSCWSRSWACADELTPGLGADASS